MTKPFSQDLNEPLPIKTDAAEQAFLEAYIRSIYEDDYDELAWDLTVDRPLGKWFRLVKGLKSGKYLGYDSYGNSLASRATLQHFMDEGPQSLKAKLMAVVEPLDVIFNKYTRERKSSYLLYDSEPSRWWLFREPLVDEYGNPREKLPE